MSTDGRAWTCLEDVDGGLVLDDLALRVEEVHVARRQRRLQLQPVGLGGGTVG